MIQCNKFYIPGKTSFFFFLRIHWVNISFLGDRKGRSCSLRGLSWDSLLTSFWSNTALDLSFFNPQLLEKDKEEYFIFFVPHKIPLKVKALNIVVYFYHIQRFSVYPFQHHNSKLIYVKSFQTFDKNTLIYETLNQSACQGLENGHRPGHAQVAHGH